jgi:hypothetical protein
MVYTVLKSLKYDGGELGAGEFGHHDKNKDDLVLFDLVSLFSFYLTVFHFTEIRLTGFSRLGKPILFWKKLPKTRMYVFANPSSIWAPKMKGALQLCFA